VAATVPPALLAREHADALQRSVGDLARVRPRPRSERLSGVHNPWGHAATLVNAWAFLDVCEDPALVEAVARVIGPDVVLWDSELHLEAASYLRFVGDGREGRYWPATPLAGAVALVVPGSASATTIDVAAIAGADLTAIDPTSPLYVVRYMSAASRFDRDPRASANRIAMEEQPLINFATRPLWLVSGEDRAGNDFTTGFAPAVPRWAAMQPEPH
jgi:hypothetical protein